MPSSLSHLLARLLALLFCCFGPALGQGESETTLPDMHPNQRAMVGNAKNLVMFASRYEQLAPSQIRDWLGDTAEVSVVDGTEADWRKITVAWPNLTVSINRQSIHENEMLNYLGSFQGYAYGQLAGGQMNSDAFAVYKQIGRTNNIYAMVAEEPMHEACVRLGQKMAESERALVFGNPEIYDDRFRVLLGPDGARDEEAEIPVFESAVQRRKRSLELLRKRKLEPIPLPVTAGDEAVRLRDAGVVARRFLCLAAVAMTANEIEGFDANVFIEKHNLSASLSPQEVQFLANPVEEAKPAMTWRYEAALALLWALKGIDKIGFPDKESDANLVIKAATNDAAKILETKELRAKSNILDQLDALYLSNWLTTDARIKDVPAEGLNGSVVHERLYALNWLAFDKNADWDDVSNDS